MFNEVKIFALLGMYEAQINSYFPTFRDKGDAITD